ncbi:helix-turn-helix domain-containing protein [Candidatus Dependentiae bacterium]|nr:helix-turn-helix domain-containing protein [Candidatus Dependentiae bacterium]
MNEFVFAKKRLLTANEAAEYLGIATGTFYNLVNQKVIPYLCNPQKNNGRFWRCDIKDLHNLIENNKIYNEVS